MKEFITKAASLALFIALAACTSSPFGQGKNQEQNTLRSNASVVPAAQGNVTTSTDKNGNTKLNVKVKHLAQPQRIADGAKTYVVWVQPQGAENYQNVGALKVNDNLEGTHQISIPYKTFELIVTPESSMQAQAPSNNPVFQKNISL